MWLLPCRISEVKAEVRHLYSAPNGPLKRCYRGGSAPPTHPKSAPREILHLKGAVTLKQ